MSERIYCIYIPEEAARRLADSDADTHLEFSQALQQWAEESLAGRREEMSVEVLTNIVEHCMEEYDHFEVSNTPKAQQFASYAAHLGRLIDAVEERRSRL